MQGFNFKGKNYLTVRLEGALDKQKKEEVDVEVNHAEVKK